MEAACGRWQSYGDRRRRRLLVLGLVVCAIIVILGGIIQSKPAHPPPGAGGLPLALLNPREWHWRQESFECVEYVVGRDDTLWGIAERYYPDQDPRKMVWAISKASKLEGPDGPVIKPGQILWIPDPALYGVGRDLTQLAAGK